MRAEITSCEDALRVLTAYLDGELDATTDRNLERHLETCRNCFSRAEFERRLKERVADTGREPVRPELSRRVQTLIREFNVSGTD